MSDRDAFVDRWYDEIEHIERWVRSHVVSESVSYFHESHTSCAAIFVRDGKVTYGASADARCRRDDVPDARIGRELARDRAVQDVVMQVLIARIARDVCKRQHNTDSIIALIAQTVRESLEARAKCAQEVTT